MKQSSVNRIIATLDRSNVEPLDRPRVIQFELAKHIAYSLPMPSSPLKSAKMHFVEQLRGTALEKIDAFNEVHVVDYKVVERAVETIWTARYRTVFDENSPYALEVARQCYAPEYKESGMAKVATLLDPALDSEITWHLNQGFRTENIEDAHGEVNNGN